MVLLRFLARNCTSFCYRRLALMYIPELPGNIGAEGDHRTPLDTPLLSNQLSHTSLICPSEGSVNHLTFFNAVFLSMTVFHHLTDPDRDGHTQSDKIDVDSQTSLFVSAKPLSHYMPARSHDIASTPAETRQTYMGRHSCRTLLLPRLKLDRLTWDGTPAGHCFYPD